MANGHSNIAGGGGLRGVPLPPGVEDMLFGAKPDRDMPVLNEGQPPIHPNEVQFEANANEVIMVCFMTTGDGGERPFKKQEVARLVFSWHAMEMMSAMCGQLLVESLPTREAMLEQTLMGVKAAREQYERAVAAQQQPPPPEGAAD